MGSRQRNRMSLLVRNIKFQTSPDRLREVFERYGSIRDVYMPTDYYTHRPRGFGFVEYYDEHDAEIALDNLDQYEIDGNRIEVTLAQRGRSSPESMRNREPRYRGGKDRYRGRSRSRSWGRSRDRYNNGRRSVSYERRRERSHSRDGRRDKRVYHREVDYEDRRTGSSHRRYSGRDDRRYRNDYDRRDRNNGLRHRSRSGSRHRRGSRNDNASPLPSNERNQRDENDASRHSDGQDTDVDMPASLTAEAKKTHDGSGCPDEPTRESDYQEENRSRSRSLSS